MEPGSERVDERLLLEVLSDFAHPLGGRFDVSEVLYRLAENVVAILGVAGAGVSVADDRGLLRPVTAINELTAQLERVEEANQQGPCVDSFHQGVVIRVARLSEETARWPEWCAEAKRHGIEAVLGVPLRAGDAVVGAMNIYNAGAREWIDSDVQVVGIPDLGRRSVRRPAQHARRHGAGLRSLADAVVNLGLRPPRKPPSRS